MVIFGVVDCMPEFASSFKAAVGSVVAELEASLAIGAGVLRDVLAKGTSLTE